MTKNRKGRADLFADLTWDHLEEWAGSQIVSRGEKYQRQGRVSDLARTRAGALLAWVSGTRRYATKVVMEEEGLPESACTCPYGSNCKHGVAVVLEYLERIKANRSVPQARANDDRLVLLEDHDRGEWSEEEAGLPAPAQMEIEPFLQDKSKAQLVELLLELARQHPDIAQDLMDRQQITSGSTKKLVARLRKEIREAGRQPDWEDDWRGGGSTADYPEIRRKLEELLEAGYADEVLSLGRELLIAGTLQVEESYDEGETAEEVSACMPVVVKALEQSSLSPAARLAWAVEVALKDSYDLCGAFEEYLDRRHPKEAWNTLANQLLTQLKTFEPPREADEFSRSYARERLVDWVIHALEQAGRSDEIIPLCEAEARQAKSYDRLVEWLLYRRRYEEAEHWIREGIQATARKRGFDADSLRERFQTLLTRRKNWPALAAFKAEEFARVPSLAAWADCEKTARRIDAWPQVREHLLVYLETGVLPWKQKGWPLPGSGLEAPEPPRQQPFPMVEELIDIAIAEKDAERVLYWYDRRPKRQVGWMDLDEDRIAEAIEMYAPDRALAIWRSKAENLIAQVSPRAYETAAHYLRKAGALMARQGRQPEWTQYLQGLKAQHARKTRLLAVLNRLSTKPIAAKK